MTYEQFLKQLRRIGRGLIISSVVVPLGFLVARYITKAPLRTVEICMLLTIFTILFFSGLVIYPSESDE